MRIRSAGWIALLGSALLAGAATATEHEMMDEAEATTPAAAAPEAPPAAPASEMSVARATFTTLVAEREPQDEVTRLTNENNRIIFFTDLRDMTGKSVTHVWERDGVVMARVPFSVKGPRWRVYSTKNLEPSWVGEWTVKVVDDQGNELESKSFSYVSVAQAPAETQTQTMPASMPE
ncbi:MAG: DUF2914 domain-containing protein [Myxococcota bacterium]|nr:DUF2914 domain-containing protein [Myxococcota bacterium]